MKTQTMDLPADTALAPTMENLLLELSRYREQSERLRRINLLHQRLAGVLDLPAMIEAFSIWLMEWVDHELVGYHNPERQHAHVLLVPRGPSGARPSSWRGRCSIADAGVLPPTRAPTWCTAGCLTHRTATACSPQAAPRSPLSEQDLEFIVDE